MFHLIAATIIAPRLTVKTNLGYNIIRSTSTDTPDYNGPPVFVLRPRIVEQEPPRRKILHMDSYFNSESSKYECPNCDKEYKAYDTLRKHLRNVCQKKPRYHCSICPYVSYTKSGLNYHLRNSGHGKLIS